MVKVTLDDFNPACKVDVEVTQCVAPSEVIDKVPNLPKTSNESLEEAENKEEPNVKATLKATDWADTIQVTLFGEGHVLRTRDLLEAQLKAYYQWRNTPEPPPPPKDPQTYISKVQQLKEIDEKVLGALGQTSSKEDRIFSEQQRKAYLSWQDSDVYQKYQFLQEGYLESLKPPPPPRDWSQKEYPDLLELQNEQFLKWYIANRAFLENLLKPEVPLEEISIKPPTPPPPPKDVNIYIKNMEKTKEVEKFWEQNGPYVFWPVHHNPATYYLELQKYWMGKWEYTEEYLTLCRGVIRKKEKKKPSRVLKWWEWKPVSNLYTEEREPIHSFDYKGLPISALSHEYKGEDEKQGEDEKLEIESISSSVVSWDTQSIKSYKSSHYKLELAEEQTKMLENRILWDKEPRPLNMDAIYKETYEVIVKTQPNFI